MTATVIRARRERRFACGPRGYWIEDADGRQPYRPARMAVRWYVPGHGWRPRTEFSTPIPRVESGGVIDAVTIAPEGQTPAEPDSAAWVKVGSRD
jgi:hypothetical protein